MSADWKVEHGPQRDPARDQTCAIFIDEGSGHRAKVSVATRTLGKNDEVGKGSTRKKQHAIDFLRAMLENFVEGGHELSAGELTEVDETVVQMSSVKRKFSNS